MIAAEDVDESDMGDAAERGAGSSKALRLDRATAAAAAGRPVLMVDDVVRPTRVDVVLAAATIETEGMSFVIRHTSGFVQVSIPSPRCAELDIGYQRGASNGVAQQRVTVDAADGIGTGISAADRAVTARLLASGSSVPSSFTRPGHVVPLAVDTGSRTGVFGFAEASSMLVRAASMGECAVLSTMTDFPSSRGLALKAACSAFAREFSLPVVATSDFIAEPDARSVWNCAFDLPFGRVGMFEFSVDGIEGVGLVMGQVANGLAVPVCVVPTTELIMAAIEMGAGDRIVLGVPPGKTLIRADVESVLLRDAGPDSPIRSATVHALGIRSIDLMSACPLRSL